MTWRGFPQELHLKPIAKGPPEALVAVLADGGSAVVTLYPAAARWASTVPTTEFAVLGIEPTVLDRTAHRLEQLFEQELLSRRLDLSRLVLVGFGYGGALGLHMVLRRGWRPAGILAIAPKPLRPPPRSMTSDVKIRLIGCAEDDHLDHHSLRKFVSLLAAGGIDARGALLAGSALSDEAIRHGGAYLVELVATAQRSARFSPDRERHRSAARFSTVPE